MTAYAKNVFSNGTAQILFCNYHPKFWTDRFGQTMQTKIRLPIGEQSDQGFQFLLIFLHHLDHIMVEPFSLKFRKFTVKLVGVRKFRR